ncbi:MAG: response regulator [Candidatus Contendobacter sp.]
MNIKKALVVDDSKVAHLTLRKLLLERGVEVDWVGSGEECIKYLGVRKPAAIFMDVMMPGMDGFETTRVITSQKLQGPPPIIMCSANATDEDKRDAQESGAIGFLSKPYTPEQLDDVLRLVSQAAASPVEKGAAPTAPVVPPPVVATQESQPASAAAPPVPKTPTVAPAAAQTAEVSASEIEQIAERAAWAAAEKVARDIIQELVPSLARETAMQAARGVSEDLGRRSAHAAVRAAQEAAKQVATEIARSAAERTARSTAQESARSVAEQAARQISEGVSQRSVARGLELNRDELLAEIEQKVGKKIRETLGIITGAPDFKQQILQMVRSNIQPVIETIARETAERTVQQEAANLGASGGAGRATMALALAAVAFIGSMVALGRIFGLF